MTTRERIDKWLNEYQIAAKKSYGQNFLVDDRAIDGIVNRLNAEGAANVIEIGCGLGALTIPLVSRGTEVFGYEIDSDVIRVLQKELCRSNFHLLEKNFLSADLSGYDAANCLIVGNLPYYITRKLIEKVVLDRQAFNFGFMVQKEVADKLFFRPGSILNNELSAYLALCGELELVVSLPPSSFYPAPKVSSAFLLYRPRTTDMALYKRLKKIYSGHNKALKSLFAPAPELVRQKLLEIIEVPTLRAHQLSLDQLRALVELPLF